MDDHELPLERESAQLAPGVVDLDIRTSCLLFYRFLLTRGRHPHRAWYSTPRWDKTAKNQKLLTVVALTPRRIRGDVILRAHGRKERWRGRRHARHGVPLAARIAQTRQPGVPSGRLLCLKPPDRCRSTTQNGLAGHFHVRFKRFHEDYKPEAERRHPWWRR